MIYIVFIAFDLLVANILLALGMQMISPPTISLPFKLLLFVPLDGWSLLVQGSVLSDKVAGRHAFRPLRLLRLQIPRCRHHCMNVQWWAYAQACVLVSATSLGVSGRGEPRAVEL